MKLTKVAVLVLYLISLGSTLVVMIFGCFAFFKMGSMSPSFKFGMTETFFIASILIFGIPPSLIPALIGWIVKERFIRPHEISERQWHEAAAWREERLGKWISYVSELISKYQAVRGNPLDPLPIIMRSEVPRALHELDKQRGERFLLFLRETGFRVEADTWRSNLKIDDPVQARAEGPPKRSIFMFLIVLFSITGAFFLFLTVIIALNMTFVDPAQRWGIVFSRGEMVLAILLLSTPALLCGLAAFGLQRIYKNLLLHSNRMEASGQLEGGLTFQRVVEQFSFFDKWREGKSVESNKTSRRLARALILISVSELDSSLRGQLIRFLFDHGWLTGESSLPLKGIDLRGAELGQVQLAGVRLLGANLGGSVLNEAHLEGAILRGCSLSGSDLRGCCLSCADLAGADLRHARLQTANLENANLTDAIIDGANFWNCKLEGANFAEVRGSAEYLSHNAKSASKE